MNNTKRCTKCKSSRTIEDFYEDKKTKDGLSLWCKDCCKKATKKQQEKNRIRNTTIIIPEFKKCSGCKIEKSCTLFNKNKTQPDGLSGYCKECSAAKDKIRYERNKAREDAVPPEYKTCSKCGFKKLGILFNRHKGQKDGFSRWCKDCCSKGTKTLRKKNGDRQKICIPKIKICSYCYIEKANSAFYKDKGEKDGLSRKCKECFSISQRESTYGVSKEWFDSILKAQGGVCAICTSPDTGLKGKAFAVDHNHKTNRVRGLLCSKCNTALGSFKDSVELLKSAIAYLEKHDGNF